MSRVLPILFNTEMVRAILDGRKTVTRRVVKQSVWENFICERGKVVNWLDYKTDTLEIPVYKALYKPGDILYVRETWNINNLFSEDDEEFYVIFEYKADGAYSTVKISKEMYEKYEESMAESMPEWRPSIHMPKLAARIWLKVTDVRVERLQEITQIDMWKEGARAMCMYPVQFSADIKPKFVKIWNSSFKKTVLSLYGWDANPWVWVIRFERCEKLERLEGSGKV